MRKDWLAIVLMILFCVTLGLVISCGGGDDDDDDDDDDDEIPSGNCSGYCQKNISCGDTSWNNVDACVTACDGSPNKNCVLGCDTGLTCGDWFDCLAGC